MCDVSEVLAACLPQLGGDRSSAVGVGWGSTLTLDKAPTGRWHVHQGACCSYGLFETATFSPIKFLHCATT